MIIHTVPHVPFRRALPRSWTRCRLLVLASLLILSGYRLEWGYAALITHSILMDTYLIILKFVLLIPPVVQSALIQAPVCLYKYVERSIWEFYASVQVLWEALLSLRDKSLRWVYRTSLVVVHRHRSAIRAAARLSKKCRMVISEVYEVLRDLPPPSFIPDRARVLETSRKLRSIWIAGLQHSSPASSLPNHASASLVESTLSSTPHPPGYLPLPPFEDQMEAFQEMKNPRPKASALPPFVPSSLTVKEVAELNPKSVLFAPEPFHGPLLVPSAPSAALHSRAQGSVWPQYSEARITSGFSVPPSPPHKRLRSVNARQTAATASADGLEVEGNGLNVSVKQRGRMGFVSLSAAPAVRGLRPRLGPMVTAVPIDAVLPVLKSRPSLFAPTSLPLVRVPQQETAAQVPALIVTLPTPPSQIGSTTTTDQELPHTNFSPAVATPTSSKPIFQSGTEAARHAGVSTVGADYFAHVRGHQTQQTFAQGNQHPSADVTVSSGSHWPNLQPEFLATTAPQETPYSDGDVHMASPTIPSMQFCSPQTIQPESPDIEMRDGDILITDTLEGGSSDMELDSPPLVHPPPLANMLFPSPMVIFLPYSTWNSSNSNAVPGPVDIPSAGSAFAELKDVDMADVESSVYSQALAPPMVENNPGVPLNVFQPHPPRVLVSHPPISNPTIHQTSTSVPAGAIKPTSPPTSVSASVALTDPPSAVFTNELTHQYYEDPSRKDNKKLVSADETYDVPIAAGTARACPARTSNQSRTSQPQQRVGCRDDKGQACSPRASSIQQVVPSQASAHELHGLPSASEGHEVQMAPSLPISGAADDRIREITSEIQPSSPSTVVAPPQPTRSNVKAPPSSPVAGPSRSLHRLPAPRHRPLGYTTLLPLPPLAARNEEAKTDRGTTQNVETSLTLPVQQLEAAMAATSNMGSPSSPIAVPSRSLHRLPAPRYRPPGHLTSLPLPPPAARDQETNTNEETSQDVETELELLVQELEAAMGFPPPSNAIAQSSCPADRPAAPHSYKQQGSSSNVQSTSSTVTVAGGGASSFRRSRPKWLDEWLDDLEEQEQMEN